MTLLRGFDCTQQHLDDSEGFYLLFPPAFQHFLKWLVWLCGVELVPRYLVYWETTIKTANMEASQTQFQVLARRKLSHLYKQSTDMTVLIKSLQLQYLQFLKRARVDRG